MTTLLRNGACRCLLVVVPFVLALGCGSDDDGGRPGSDAGGTGDLGPDSANLDETEAVMARVSACLESGDRIGIGLMYSLFDAYQRLADISASTDLKLTGVLLNCYIDASTCEQIRACNHATEAQAAVCSGTDTDAHCSGNVLVECTDDAEEDHEAYDCAAAGLVCGEGEYDADCGESACLPGIDATRCEGDVLWECDYASNVYTAEDCRFSMGYHCSSQGENDMVCVMNAGGTCGEDPDYEDEHRCIGTGSECDESTFQNRCQGTTLVSCKAGREANYDCRNSGSSVTCGAGEEGGMECVQAQGQCSLATPETCNGGVITYCAAGRTDQLDCRSHGYGGCAVGTGVLGTVAGYCTP